MPVQHDDLHGNVPDDAEAALLLIDVINDLEFDGGEALLTQAMPASWCMRAIPARAPVPYPPPNLPPDHHIAACACPSWREMKCLA